MRWSKCKFVAFDVETTGLKPCDDDRIIEFGAIEFQCNESGRLQKIEQYNWLLDPERELPTEITRVTNIQPYMLRNKPKFEELAETIHSLFKGAIVVAHNFVFDLSFLKAEFALLGMCWPNTLAEIDTLLLARKFMKLKSNRLGVVAEELGFKLTNAHRAKDDAEACAEILAKMLVAYRAPLIMEPFVEWADAIVPPPQNNYLSTTKSGVRFLDGPYKGESIERFPEHLYWMQIAKIFNGECWEYRFSNELRLWVSNWLRVRIGGNLSVLKTTKPKSSDWLSNPELEAK